VAIWLLMTIHKKMEEIKKEDGVWGEGIIDLRDDFLWEQ